MQIDYVRINNLGHDGCRAIIQTIAFFIRDIDYVDMTKAEQQIFDTLDEFNVFVKDQNVTP